MGVIASPSVRKLAADRGVDIDALAKGLGRETIGREDVLGQTRGAPPSGATYWDVDHAERGPVTVEPLNRMAQVASGNLAAAQALIPAVTHHDRPEERRVGIGCRSRWLPFHSKKKIIK